MDTHVTSLSRMHDSHFLPGLSRISALTVLTFGLVAGGTLASCSKDRERDSTSPRKVEVASPIQMDSVVVYSSYPATLESDSEADVVARVNGQITHKYFENGAYVSKGQALFSIEPTVYAAQVNEYKAQVASAESQLDYASKHLRALEQAYADNAVAKMDVIQAQSARDEAQAEVNQAKATLATAATRLGYCTVTAPVSGRISAATLDVGAYVAGENAPVTLATIYDEGNLEACFSIADHEYVTIADAGEGFRNPIYRNIPVSIGNAEDSSAPQFRASVVYESPSVESSSGNIKMKARLLTSDKRLRPGMYGLVMLPTGIVDNALLVNDASISTDQRGKYLYVVNDSDRIVYTPIEVGQLYQDTLRLVTKGLKATDRYVTRAMLNVRAGEKVIPTPADNKSTSTRVDSRNRK